MKLIRSGHSPLMFAALMDRPLLLDFGVLRCCQPIPVSAGRAGKFPALDRQTERARSHPTRLPQLLTRSSSGRPSRARRPSELPKVLSLLSAINLTLLSDD